MTSRSRALTLMAALSATVLTGCHFGRPDTNGGTDQPIEHGWTYEQAAEYWMASVITTRETAARNGEREPLTPEELATLSEGHVRVQLPVSAGDPMPRMGATYRQRDTGGTITFRDTIIAGDTLNTVAMVCYHFCEPLNFSTDSAGVESYVQRRGKGIFTCYHQRLVRNRETQQTWHEPAWDAVIVSVRPGADTLLVSRGTHHCEPFVIP